MLGQGQRGVEPPYLEIHGSWLGKALSNLLESGSKWGFDLLWHKLLRLLLHSTRVLLDDTCIWYRSKVFAYLWQLSAMRDTEFFFSTYTDSVGTEPTSDIFFSVRPVTVTELISQIFEQMWAVRGLIQFERVVNKFSGDHCFVSGLYSFLQFVYFILFVCLFVICYHKPQSWIYCTIKLGPQWKKRLNNTILTTLWGWLLYDISLFYSEYHPGIYVLLIPCCAIH